MIQQKIYSTTPLIYETKSDRNMWIKSELSGALYVIAYDPSPKKYSETEEPINESTSD